MLTIAEIFLRHLTVICKYLNSNDLQWLLYKTRSSAFFELQWVGRLANLVNSADNKLQCRCRVVIIISIG